MWLIHIDPPWWIPDKITFKSSLYFLIIMRNDFHKNPFSGFKDTALIMSYLGPELPTYSHNSNELSVCDAFDYTHISYTINTFHIIISIFNTKLYNIPKMQSMRFFCC